MPRSLSLNNIHMNTHLLFGSTRFFFLSSISNLACKKSAKCINQGQIDVILTFIDSYKCLVGTWYYYASSCAYVFQYVWKATMSFWCIHVHRVVIRWQGENCNDMVLTSKSMWYMLVLSKVLTHGMFTYSLLNRERNNW